MLIFLECRVQSEHHVQCLYHIVVTVSVNRNVQDVACHLAILFQTQIYFLTGECYFGQDFLNFLGPNLHQTFDIWHFLRVGHWWRLFIFVDIRHSVDPVCDLFWVLFCTFQTVNFAIFVTSILLKVVHHHQVNFGFVGLVQWWFILALGTLLPQHEDLKFLVIHQVWAFLGKRQLLR